MQQRDILKDQIEQLGQAIGKAISHFFGLKNEGEILQGIEAANEVLQNELDLNVEELVNLPTEKLNKYFTENKYTGAQIEQLAKYLFEVGEYERSNKQIEALQFYKAALELLQVAGSKSKVFSLERSQQEDKINAIIKEMN